MGCGFCGEDLDDSGTSEKSHWQNKERGKLWCKNRPKNRNGSILTKKDLAKI